jgi:hypothetical protein
MQIFVMFVFGCHRRLCVRFMRLGKDADDMFEDIGHSSEAIKIMKQFLVGTLLVRSSL